MKKLFLFLFTSFIILAEASAQFTRYIVRLKNKGGTPYTFTNPSVYLSQRAIDRRTRYGIAIDSSDLPATPSYVNQVRAVPNVTILNVSRWLNSISIQTSDPNAINTINSFSFVQSVNPIAARNDENGGKSLIDKFGSETERTAADFFNYGTASYNEIHLHNGEFLHNIGLRGQGMHIAVLDAGFLNYTTLRAFDSARLNGQILSTWDFVAREQSVVEDHVHGMQVLSTIAANIPGQFIGKAPKASFHLYRTEDAPTEYPIEEHNWVCGAERADSIGAEVINSSLGYTTFDNPIFNHTYAEMNGNTTMSAIGADLAAKKGLLVFIAAGNEGGNSWNFISTPSDADSVVAVGAVNVNGVVGAFSGYGPSSDGQVKPDVASVGVTALVQTTSNTVGAANGTSFASPNMSGLGACLWQGFPEFNNMKIIQALRQAGSKAANPDNRVGYGIPNMKIAFGNLLTEYATSSSTITGCRVTGTLNTKDMGAMRYEIERKGPADVNFTKVAELPAQAASILTNRSYQFTYDLPGGSQGNFQFRIRQILDTSAAGFYAVYIDTTTINIASSCIVTGNPTPDPTKVSLKLTPNPVSASLVTLTVETPYAVTDMPVIIYNSNGEMVMKLQHTKGSGKKDIGVDISRLSKGVYYFRVMNGSNVIGVAELIRQ